jgi:dCMP deaminase
MIARISRQHLFMQMAEASALRSTCFRRAIGAILISDNNVISMGYNGPSAGEEHCTGKNCPSSDGCKRAVHAEYNAIHRCHLARPFTTHVDLYTTESPCPSCAHLIIASGIRSVYFKNEYRLREGITILLDHIPVFRLTSSGYTIDCATEDMV